MHFHWIKSEDTANRGGGMLQIKIYQMTAKAVFQTKMR